MYKLRDYQQKASDAAVSFFNNKAKKTNAIMVLPTGSGKSLIIADIAARLDGHTLVFQPSKEILEQNFKKLCSYGILDNTTFRILSITMRLTIFLVMDVLVVPLQDVNRCRKSLRCFLDMQSA